MGGSGSTRWTFHWKKTTVEECLKLSVAELRRAYGKSVASWAGSVGIMTWSNGAQVAFLITDSDTGTLLKLNYTATTRGEKQVKAPTIHISTTACNYGGVRYWFHCPNCNRRVAKLYVNQGNFACRHCHDLSYTSAQEAHQFDSLRRILGLGFDRLDKSFEAQRLMDKWDDRKRLTRGERKKIADALRVPLFIIRSRWYRPATRLKQANEAADFAKAILA